jgi:predicted RNA-binding Zn-ribbon protein involved in translation (DUF1610 family)
MGKTKTPLSCPNCGGTPVAVRVPSDKEYAKAFDKENPGMLPANSDTASPEQRAELGALYRCGCGYVTRVATDGNGATADDK